MHYHFEDRLTTRDCKRHIPHPFIVPAGSEQIDIDFRFEPDGAHGVSNLLTLTVFDPDGFRGAGHRGGTRHQVRIGSTAATPGYLPGPLPAGEWTVQIDTHMIMPGEPVRYWLDVTISESAEATISAPASVMRSPGCRSLAAGRGPGWYRGDLHSHTNHSDAGTAHRGRAGRGGTRCGPRLRLPHRPQHDLRPARNGRVDHAGAARGRRRRADHLLGPRAVPRRARVGRLADSARRRRHGAHRRGGLRRRIRSSSSRIRCRRAIRAARAVRGASGR